MDIQIGFPMAVCLRKKNSLITRDLNRDMDGYLIVSSENFRSFRQYLTNRSNRSFFSPVTSAALNLTISFAVNIDKKSSGHRAFYKFTVYPGRYSLSRTAYDLHRAGTWYLKRGFPNFFKNI